jgi:ATP-dependent Lon protease
MTFDNQAVEIPQTLPMLPVRDIVVFPYMIIPLFVGRESSIRSVEEALSKNRLIFLASQKDIAEENPTPNSIYEIGTIASSLSQKQRAALKLQLKKLKTQLMPLNKLKSKR